MARERLVTATTPFPPEDLRFRRMAGSEECGRLFEFTIDLLSPKDDLKIEDILGKKITLTLELPDESCRYFNGHVSRFSLMGREGNFAVYQAIVHPWLWFLTRTTDCRIFQDMTVPDIVKSVFKRRGFTDVEDALDPKAYRGWRYCVQYRETDFNFVSRLMEQEGIYYFFKHEDGKHTLVLADSLKAHEKVSGETLAFFPPVEGDVRSEDHIREWIVSQEVQPGAVALRDYDFKRPDLDQTARSEVSRSHEHAKFEIYDYPGDYFDPDEAAKTDNEDHGLGSNYARTRLEEIQTGYEQVRASGNVRALGAGHLFTLEGHSRGDQNRDYLVLSAAYSLTANEYESGDIGSPEGFDSQFVAITSKQVFRPHRRTPRPVIQGPQTATVVGKSSEEIDTDKYGRVRVHFHWDRHGTEDQNSTCWVRVASVWAGKAWGGIHIPRIGEEVIVEFLEGDPNRPIITGRVYNDLRMPPYELPANKTQSGMKSRSSKGAGVANFNELRFEDMKGSEEVYFHAEKQFTQIVEVDRSEDVGHDRSLHVGHDKSESVDNNKSITIGVDHTESIGSNKKMSIGANHDETIGSNKTLSVGANHTEDVGSNMTISVGSSLTETVAVNYAETVGAAMELTIGALMTETVGAAKIQSIGAAKTVTIGGSHTVSVGGAESVTVGAAQSVKVAAAQSVSVGADQSESVSGGKKVSVGKDLAVSVSGGASETVTKAYALKAKTVSIVADDEIMIKTGSASINMKKNGDISIEGKKITITGSGDVVLKGTKVSMN